MDHSTQQNVNLSPPSYSASSSSYSASSSSSSDVKDDESLDEDNRIAEQIEADNEAISNFFQDNVYSQEEL